MNASGTVLYILRQFTCVIYALLNLFSDPQFVFAPASCKERGGGSNVALVGGVPLVDEIPLEADVVDEDDDFVELRGGERN